MYFTFKMHSRKFERYTQPPLVHQMGLSGDQPCLVAIYFTQGAEFQMCNRREIGLSANLPTLFGSKLLAHSNTSLTNPLSRPISSQWDKGEGCVNPSKY